MCIRDSNELALMSVCSIMYTTNFDDFIERSFGLHRRQYRAVAIEEHMRPEPNTTEITGITLTAWC